ncbi:MAG: hypothetical protein ACXAAO_05120 [Candidatus Thorarchaeota archaeon]
MDTKIKAAIMIIILISAGAVGVFLILGGLPASEPTYSSFNGNAWINEVHMNSTLTVDEEYVEIYVSDSYSDSTITGWKITTFGTEGQVALPTISNVDAEDFIAVYTGTGNEDLDASDGTAIVYLGLTERILDPDGDEVALYDASDLLIHYMRYAGGDGGPLHDGWPTTDDGPSLPAGHAGSLSYFGQDKTNTSSWLESLTTPGDPNVYMFRTTTTTPLYDVTITSGVKTAFSFTGIDDTKEAGKNETVDVFPAAGVNASTVKAIEEFIEFSLGFYEGKGFNRGPATYKPGRINVTVSQGTTTESTGSCNTDGEIVIELGTIASLIDLKYVCEHELMHAFQFKTENTGKGNQDHAPTANKWWIEGQATYWGIESTKANYNLTNAEIQDEFDRVGDHNWNDHYTDLNRSITLGWGGSYSDYMGSYLIMKWISETFGEDKLKEIFDKAKDNFGNDSEDVSPEDAASEVLGLPWDTLLAMFHAWMMSGAVTDNGVPERTGHVNVTYSGTQTGDSITVAPSGAGVERIAVDSDAPFTLDFETEPGSVWKITVIYVYSDGSREQADNTPRTYAGTSAPWPVNPGAHDKELVEVIVIKTLCTSTASQINMTVTPVNPIGPQPLTPNNPEPFTLPPGFWNFTDPHDFPWSRSFYFNYTLDTFDHTLAVDIPDPWVVDSFFDIIIRIEHSPLRTDLDHLNVSASDANPYVIPWDPNGLWPLDMYNITIVQRTLESVLNGTIEDIAIPLDGRDFYNPHHHDHGDLVGQDSNQHRTTGDKWFTTVPSNASAFEYFLDVDIEYNLTADWNMELYVATDPTAPIRSTVGDYVTGEWPRTMSVPTILDPDWSEDGFILRVIYGGEYATGLLQHAVDEVPGSAIDNPIWHIAHTTELLDIPMPYVVTGELFINVSVSIGLDYQFWFNDTAHTGDLTAEIWDGNFWIAMIDAGTWYTTVFTAATDVLCIRIAPGSGQTLIHYIWSDFGS